MIIIKTLPCMHDVVLRADGTQAQVVSIGTATRHMTLHGSNGETYEVSWDEDLELVAGSASRLAVSPDCPEGFPIEIILYGKAARQNMDAVSCREARQTAEDLFA